MTTPQMTKVLALVIIASAAACTPIYRANTTNVPMLDQKGDVAVSGHLSTAGYELQAAGAVTDELGVMVNGALFSSTDAEGTDYEHRVLELGAGWFKPLGEVWKFETFGGYGLGQGGYQSASSALNANYNKLFIQPSLGASSEVIDFAITPRMTFVNFNQINRQVNDGFQLTNNWAAFLEPSFTLRVGYQAFKGQFQMGLVLPMTDANFDYDVIKVSFGLNYQLFARYRN